MKQIMLPAKQIGVTNEVDVLVVGGGYAGFGAALAAAKNGSKTMIIEQLSALGGLVTMGYVGLTFSYIEGVGLELFSELRKAEAVNGRFLDVEKTKVVLEKMLQKAGVEILYSTSVVDAVVEDNVIKGVVTHNKSGLNSILAKCIIDASGDGDVAAYAGVPFESGCDELKNFNQATSLVCRIGNVNMKVYHEFVKGNDCSSIWTERFEKAVEDGEFPYLFDKRVNWLVQVPGRDIEHQEILVCYAHSRNCRCLDAADLSRQLIEQREQNQLFMKFCIKHIPGFEHAWLIDTAPLMGVRDSRRIMCEYKVTADDLVDQRRFPDAVMRGMHAFDAHHPTEVGHIKHIVRKDKAGNETKHYIVPGNWREIPYRALVTLKIDNLLVAGRNFSSDFMAQSGNRLVMECLNMGQAAGTAAALSVKDNIAPRKLDVGKLRRRLIEMGVNLEEKPEYGARGLSTSVEIKKDDILFPEDSKEYLDTAVLKDSAARKYEYVGDKLVEQKLQKMMCSDNGYTSTGGDVGTNLE